MKQYFQGVQQYSQGGIPFLSALRRVRHTAKESSMNTAWQEGDDAQAGSQGYTGTDDGGSEFGSSGQDPTGFGAPGQDGSGFGRVTGSQGEGVSGGQGLTGAGTDSGFGAGTGSGTDSGTDSGFGTGFLTGTGSSARGYGSQDVYGTSGPEGLDGSGPLATSGQPGTLEGQGGGNNASSGGYGTKDPFEADTLKM